MNNNSNALEQERIHAQMELDELMTRNVYDDEEFYNTRLEMTQRGDEEQLSQYDTTAISKSEFDTRRKYLENRIKEIDRQMKVTKNDRKLETEIKAIRYRGQLRKLKDYYKSIDRPMMREYDIDNMNDEEIIRLYNDIEKGLGSEKLTEMIRKGMRYSINSEDNDSKDNKDSEKDSQDIQKSLNDKIEIYKSDSDEIKNVIDKIRGSLVLDEEIDFDLTEEIKGLNTDLMLLDEEAKLLIADIDSFKEQISVEDLSMTPKEIENNIKNLKNRLKDLKIHQIDKYNSKVEATNKKIAELKAMTDLDPEIAALISELSELSLCDQKIAAYKDTKYLTKIDYHMLIDMNKKISDIENRLGISRKAPSSLEDDIRHIEQEIVRIESEINDNLSSEIQENLKQDILVVADNINCFRIRLENNKENISEEQYNNYLDRINDAEANLADLNSKLNLARNNVPSKTNDEINEYKEYLNKINEVSLKVDNTNHLIDALYGKVVEDALSVFETDLNNCTLTLDTLEQEIEEKHESGLLDDVQYNNLTEKITEVREKITLAQNKLKEPNMVKDVDVFAFLNGQIDGIEQALDALEQQIAALDKPIKKDQRKQIDLIITKLENEIKIISNELELHKEDDEEKYNATKERLENTKKRLDEISKQYRKKCPFLVKTVKTAKDFYKKHKKLVLIAAGLAAIAIVHATIGPIIIPAIMHGNLLMGASTPALRGVLGKAINAKVVNGFWELASGVRLSPYCASASLLKGLAISGLGTAAIVTPLVLAIRELIKKMNLAELKEKISKGKEKIQETKDKVKTKIKETKEKTTEKVKEKATPKTNKNTKAKKTALEEIKQLLIEYKKSNLSLEEFCNQKELSEDDKELLSIYDKKVGGR